MTLFDDAAGSTDAEPWTWVSTDQVNDRSVSLTMLTLFTISWPMNKITIGIAITTPRPAASRLTDVQSMVMYSTPCSANSPPTSSASPEASDIASSFSSSGSICGSSTCAASWNDRAEFWRYFVKLLYSGLMSSLNSALVIVMPTGTETIVSKKERFWLVFVVVFIVCPGAIPTIGGGSLAAAASGGALVALGE